MSATSSTMMSANGARKLIVPGTVKEVRFRFVAFPGRDDGDNAGWLKVPKVEAKRMLRELVPLAARVRVWFNDEGREAYIEGPVQREIDMNAAARKLLDALPGLKARELDGAICPLCDQPLVTGNYPPLFFRVNVERFGIDGEAVTRQHGLGLMLGSHALARVMGPDQDAAKLIAGPRRTFICEPCVLDKLAYLMVLLEQQPIDEVSCGDSSTRAPGYHPGDRTDGTVTPLHQADPPIGSSA